MQQSIDPYLLENLFEKKVDISGQMCSVKKKTKKKNTTRQKF